MIRRITIRHAGGTLHIATVESTAAVRRALERAEAAVRLFGLSDADIRVGTPEGHFTTVDTTAPMPRYGTPAESISTTRPLRPPRRSTPQRVATGPEARIR